MQQFFADFPSVIKKLFNAAFPDVKTVILKVLLLALFAGVELLIYKKENKIINKNTNKVWSRITFVITLVCIILFFITNTAWEFIKWLIIFAALDIINIIRTIWRRKHPDSDIW